MYVVLKQALIVFSQLRPFHHLIHHPLLNDKKEVLRIRICMDPFHFGLRDSNPSGIFSIFGHIPRRIRVSGNKSISKLNESETLQNKRKNQ